MSSKKINTKNTILETTWHLMEQSKGQGVSMSKIAKQAGVSRQALYLHFNSRVDLIIATVNYVDDIKGLQQRLACFKDAKSGEQLLDLCVDVWGNYIPEIYGLAKALLSTRETDEDMAMAWNGCMACLKDVCSDSIKMLSAEKKLMPHWSQSDAVDMFWTMISIHNWEQLTIECGWTNEQYINQVKHMLKLSFLGR